MSSCENMRSRYLAMDKGDNSVWASPKMYSRTNLSGFKEGESEESYFSEFKEFIGVVEAQ